MNGFKKIASLCAILGFACLMATGCGKMTAEKLTEKINKAVVGKQITYAEIVMDMEASYDMTVMGMDMSMDLNWSMDLNQWVNANPFAGYSEGHLNMNLLGQEIDSNIKAHTVIEDDQIISYSYVEMMDKWTREDMGISASDYEELLLTTPTIGTDTSKIVLDEETTDLEGKEVYVLHLNYTGEDIEMILSETGALNGMLDIPEGAMSEISVPAITYVDAKTFLPVQIEMDIEGMEESVNQMISQQMESMGEYMDETDVSVKVGKCHVVMKNFSYDVQEIPEVPQEALDALAFAEALENAGTTLPDGRYLLKYESNAIALPEIEGYTMNVVSDGNVEFYSNNGMQMVSISVMPAGMSEYVVSEAVSGYETLFTTLGAALETSDAPETVGTHLGDAEVNRMGTNGLNIYYSVIPVGGLETFIMALDMTGQWQDAADIIVPVTDAISEVTLEDLL